jgi:Spy/CpxP family protein refolding chaperone
MKLSKLALIVGLVAIACSAMAQGGGGRRGGGQRGGGNPYAPMTLVNREEVQKELNITDDQKAKIADLRTSVRQKQSDARAAANGDRQAMQEATAKINADAAKSLGDILTPDQSKRLRELEIQWTGPSIVVTDKDVQSSLGITDDQKAKLTDLQAKQRAANAEARTNANGDPAAMRDAMMKNSKIMEDEINKVLTDDQKAKLAAMGGKPLAKPAPQQRGGGRRAGGN